MPGNNLAPLIALFTRFDARFWSNRPLFARGATTITMPTFAAGEGVYESADHFLTGLGSYTARDLQSDITAVGTGAGNWTIELLANDRIRITNDTESFDLLLDADNPTYGYPVLGLSSSPSGGGHVVDASADWLRGLVDDQTMRLQPATGAIFEIPSVACRAQSVVHLLRATGSVGDADDAHTPGGTFASLEAIDNAAMTTDVIRWGITAEGHVYWAAPTASGITKPTWTSTLMRDRLGFSGNEAVVASGALDVQTADFPLPGLYVPTRGLARLHRRVELVAEAARRGDGSYGGQHRGTYPGWTLEYFIDGPEDPRSGWLHFVERFAQYMPPGELVNVHLEWGDPRRRLGPYQVNASTPAYSVTYTSEREGLRGRLRGYVHPDNDLARELEWGGKARRRIRARLTLDDAA